MERSSLFMKENPGIIMHAVTITLQYIHFVKQAVDRVSDKVNG